MYLESHNKLKTNLKECLKYGPGDGQESAHQQHQNNNVQSLEASVQRQHQIEVEAKMVKSERIESDDPYNNIIIDETQLIHHQNQTSSNKENNIVDMAMSMASMNTIPEPQKNGVPKRAIARGKSRKKSKATAAAQHQMMATDDQRYDNNDTNLLDISNGNANATAQELQYIILQSDTKIFSCNNCEQQFISEDFLKQHMQKAHPVLSELVQTPTLSPMAIHPQSQLIYLCHLCESKQFTSEIQLSHHMFIHSEIAAGTLSENPFPICSCDHCLPLTHDKMSIGEYETDQTQNEMVMEQHAQHAQQMQTEQVTTNQPTKVIRHTEADGSVTTLYSCSVCNKSTFKTNARLLKHMRIHSNQQPFACEICQKVYNASSSLRTHQRMVHNMVAKSGSNENGGNAVVAAATNNASSVSSSASSAAASAKNDNAIIEGGLQCSICERSFSTTNLLTTHMNTVHSKDEQRYTCQYCNYRFVSAAKLATHVKEHMDTNDVMLTTKTEDIETDDITEEVVME